MKRFLVVIGLISLLVLPLALASCTEEATGKQEQTMPPLNGGEEAKTIELTLDDFAAENHITKDIVIARPGSLIVTLGANPTTGFSWAENPEISGAAMTQVSHNYVEPQSDAIGAPGKDVWVFDSAEAGAATISFDYSRPWEGGEKAEYTLTINVTVH